MTINSDRKAPTLSRAKRRKWLKMGALPLFGAAIGVLLRVFAEFQPVEAFLKLLETIWLLLTNQQSLEIWIAENPTVKWVISWIAAPTALLMLAAVIGQLPPVRWLIDRLFPDPPAFVFFNLNAEREATMTRLDRRSTPLIGRQNELAELTELLDKNAASPAFRWKMLSGPSGVGKTRLAIEWLEQAKADGWDFGIVDPEDTELLKGWRARRPTALVIDEARSAWAELDRAMSRLQSGGRKGRPVRVVVIAQIAPYASGAAPDGIARTEVQPASALLPLSDEDMAILANALDQQNDRAKMIVRESGGRPRAAIILANAAHPHDLADAMKAWAFRVVPELRSHEMAVDQSLSMGLIASGLAGPFSTGHFENLSDNFSILPLLRFFPPARQTELERTLPLFLPEDLGQELAMRLLPRLGADLRARLIELLIENAPARLEESLGSIWRNHPSYAYGTGDDGKYCTAAMTLRAMQSAYDNRWPERVVATRQLAKDFAEVTAKFINKKPGFDLLERQLVLLQDLVNSRPFDLSFRILEAKGALSAMYAYGQAEKFEDLERWGARLVALAEVPEFLSDADIRSQEAMGAVNAISVYGQAEKFEDLERWGARLVARAEDPDFSSDADIRSQEAMGAVNAILYYGEVQKFEDLEHWGRRLTALAEYADFSSNADIQSKVAMGAVNAMTGYGQAKKFEDLERWGARLIALAEHSDFSSDADIRFQEGAGAANVIHLYGQSEKFEDLERWGARLIALAEHSNFSSDADIRIQEALGAVNAVFNYKKSQRYEDVERWGDRLISLAEDPRFSNNAEIRLYEAMGAVNAMNGYGQSEKFEDLERWGARLMALADHPDFSTNSKFRLREAMGADNAIYYLQNAGKAATDSYNLWKARLAKAALAFPYHNEIQLLAKNRGVDLIEQRSRGWPYGRGNN